MVKFLVKVHVTIISLRVIKHLNLYQRVGRLSMGWRGYAYAAIHRKSTNVEDLSLFRYLIMVCE